MSTTTTHAASGAGEGGSPTDLAARFEAKREEPKGFTFEQPQRSRMHDVLRRLGEAAIRSQKITDHEAASAAQRQCLNEVEALVTAALAAQASDGWSWSEVGERLRSCSIHSIAGGEPERYLIKIGCPDIQTMQAVRDGMVSLREGAPEARDMARTGAAGGAGGVGQGGPVAWLYDDIGNGKTSVTLTDPSPVEFCWATNIRPLYEAAAPPPPAQQGSSSPPLAAERVDLGELKQRRDENGFACEYDGSLGPNADDYTILWDNGARWLLIQRDGKITIGRSPAEGQQCFHTSWAELFANRSGHLVPASLPAGTGSADEGTDLVSYLERQWAWSKETFGPALRTKGIVQHITKELREIEAEPHDLTEWVDVIILAMDGFWRHGGKPADLLPAMQAKQDRNFARTWSDWRTMGEDQAIEHDRSGEAALVTLHASQDQAGEVRRG